MKKITIQFTEKIIWFLFPWTILILLLSSCRLFENNSQIEDVEVLEITKWKDGYKSAYSPTYDTGLPSVNDIENQWLIERGLFIDYEVVSHTYDQSPGRVSYMLEELIPNGFGYFGHGHKHDNHDELGYEAAKESFTTNFLSMKSYGLHPVSYAYPYGTAFKPETRQALKESGFLSGRLFQPEFEGYGPYIVPGDETVPPDWFALPSIRMEDIEFQGRTQAVNNPSELIEHLEENIKLGSWLISTYHGIGYDGETNGRPVGWGFYKRENFYTEMLYVKEKYEQGKIWLASMDDVTLYIQQRNNATYSLEKVDENNYRLFFDNGLDNDRFRMPLTLRIRIDPVFIGSDITFSTPEDEQIYQTVIESEELLINLHPFGIYYHISIDD